MVSMIVAVEEAFQSDAINEISQDAKLVAAALGRRTLRRASKVLDRPLVPDEKDFAKEFQPLIDKVMGGLVPSHSAA
jgi:hypothetical protein